MVSYQLGLRGLLCVDGGFAKAGEGLFAVLAGVIVGVVVIVGCVGVVVVVIVVVVGLGFVKEVDGDGGGSGLDAEGGGSCGWNGGGAGAGRASEGFVGGGIIVCFARKAMRMGKRRGLVESRAAEGERRLFGRESWGLHFGC